MNRGLGKTFGSEDRWLIDIQKYANHNYQKI